ncbi:MAG: Uma2 family endonuclease [Cyanothece sp. SIO2G6]|nr:Uma2 family endonuclease [Cyanothece sp. SIO2G6]
MNTRLTSTTVPAKAAPGLAEKRVSLPITWDGFETIWDVLGNNRAAQLTYYNGILEIMTPLEPHENASGLIGQFIEIATEEFNLTIKTMGSTRLNRSPLANAEPDQGYYIANEPRVRGKQVNLNIDPPPDLVVEVDITNTDIDKNSLYAALGIPEFWRYDGQTLRIYQLQNSKYKEVSVSPTFPNMPKEQLYSFLRDCAQNGETAAKRNLRVWLRENME